MTAAEEAGELRPVLDNIRQMREDFAGAYQGAEKVYDMLLGYEGRPLTEMEVSRRLTISPEEVERQRAAGFLLALAGEDGTFAFPSWQFTDTGTLHGLADVLAELRTHNPQPVAQLRFFLSRNLRLNGATPLTVLRQGRIKEACRAARTFGEHGAA
jgi:hypothetical protein